MPKHSHGKKKNQTNGPKSGDRSPVESANIELASSISNRVDSRPEFILPPGNIIVEQNEEIQRQDAVLDDLEASITNIRDASLSINQELTIHNRLLDDVHTNVDRVQQRQVGTQDRLRDFMQRSGTCKLWSLIIILAISLVLLLVLLK
jgi:hypothetical protein